MKKILILFAKDWDQLSIQALQDTGRYQFYFEGFDLHSFPQNVRLLSFRILPYIRWLEAKYRAIGINGVVSNHEQFGTFIAAVLAERLNLPGNEPLAVLACQHKYYSRMVQEKLVPEAVPRFTYIPFPFQKEKAIDLPYPFFVKPIKATYSVLAKIVHQPRDLANHLHFGFFEEWLIRRLVKPFADLMHLYTPLQIDPNGMIAEEILTGQQLSIDGYCNRGQVFFLGMIDETMYPGTQAFMRFEYPSQLAKPLQARAKAIAQKVLEGLNYRHGFFNMEFIYNPNKDQLKIIEINPRMASQLANLYQRVDGFNPYDILFALAVGEEPQCTPGQGHFQAAASFIFRRFYAVPHQHSPSPLDLEEALAPYPDANLMMYFKRGASLRREIRWLGSYRYAVLNLGGLNRADLFTRFRAISNKLGFNSANSRAT
jgi:hypothetical protein